MILLVLSLAVCVVACSKGSNAPDSKAVDPLEHNRRLGRGINLSDALGAPSDGLWGVTLREKYSQIIAEVASDATRIPIRWSIHASSAEPYTINASLFRRAEARGMSWGYWDFCAGLGAYHRTVNEWNAQLLEVLISQR